MNNLDVLKQMTADFAANIKELFPGYTSASIHVSKDGFQQVDVTKFEEYENHPENAKRRHLLLMNKSNYAPEWEDDSEKQNAYYESTGHLLDA